MSVKNDLIFVLKSSIGKEISGQSLAENLGVARDVICEAVQDLKNYGYPIISTRNKGYMLNSGCDVVSVPGIRSYAGNTPWQIILLDTVDSTNSYAKSVLKDLQNKPAIIAARSQTAGRGRNGHSFYSPKDTGLYISIVITPKISPATIITAAAAVAVCISCEELTDSNPTIKWVNDIFIDEKKICGILTEGIIDFETNTLSKAIVGIGINLNTKDFPDEINGIAGSLYPTNVTRNMLIGRIAQHLNRLVSGTPKEIVSEYKSRLMVLGKKVSYTLNGEVRTGVALDVNDIGNLIVNTNNGTDTLIAGEISLHKDQNKLK